MTEAYPLHWPDGWQRTTANNRRRVGERFGRNLTISKACGRLLHELALAGIDDWDVIISSNLELRLDGLPRSQQPRISDPGIAVYFTRDGTPLCMAHDLWTTAEANINALALAISGLRQMERHGGAVMVERAFAGFKALPAPGTKHWREILGGGELDTVQAIERRFKRLARERHPDHGGSESMMADLNAARDAARLELS